MKYEHRFCNSEFGDLKFSPAEVALVATLLLRGAQTSGELRTRAGRLHDFADVNEVETVLEQMRRREDGPFVVRLAREPGKRESRYMHLFSDEPLEETVPAPDDRSAEERPLAARVALLEKEVAELKRQLAELLA